MNVQTKRWARPLALFIALTMVMMYSFGGVVFANTDDKVHVHYNGSKSDTIVVTTSMGGVEYQTNDLESKNGQLYKGYFEGSLPTDFKDMLNKADTVVMLNGSTVLTIKHISADGNGVINIIIDGYEPVLINDLSITKIADDESVEVEDKVTFTIKVENIGEVDAKDVTVTDVLPAGLTFSATVPSDANYDGTTWTIGDLDVGESIELEIEAFANAIGELTNRAVLNYVDDDNTNNMDEATITVSEQGTLPTYDLKVDKSVDNNYVTLGSIVTFTISAQNLGNTTITSVQLTDTWTSGLTGAAVVTHEGISFIGNVWNVGSLAPQEVKTLELTAIAEGKGLQTNTVVGTLEEDDLDDTNNSDSVDVTVFDPTQPPEPVDDLAIAKTVNQASVTVGTGVTFTITVTNIGDTTMEAVEVEDTWPAGLTQGTANPAEGTTFSGTTWEIGTLGPDQFKTLTIAAGTPTAGTYTNNVEIVFGEVADDNVTNNTAAAIVTVTNPGTTGGGGGGGTGGGGGGGTTTTITPTPPPLAEIPETETPLVEAPEATLEDQPIPLADVPQTGDNTNIWLLLALMMGSGAGIVLLGRRKETVEK